MQKRANLFLLLFYYSVYKKIYFYSKVHNFRVVHGASETF